MGNLIIEFKFTLKFTNLSLLSYIDSSTYEKKSFKVIEIFSFDPDTFAK